MLLYEILSSPIRATCLDHHKILDLNTLITPELSCCAISFIVWHLRFPRRWIYRLWSSRLWRRVVLYVVTNVSEEHNAIFWIDMEASCSSKTLPTSPVTSESKSPWLLGRFSRQMRKSCTGVIMVFSRAEPVSILEHYFASKSFEAVREAFSNVYNDEEVPNKITIHRLVITFLDTGSDCLWQVLIERRNSWRYDRTDFKQYISCNNGIRLQEFYVTIGFVVLCVKGFMCIS
jgi:hypothetical protein